MASLPRFPRFCAKGAAHRKPGAPGRDAGIAQDDGISPAAAGPLCKDAPRETRGEKRAMPSTIRAAVCRAFGAPSGDRDAEPAHPGPGEIEVGRSEAVAVCHSDISYMEGGLGRCAARGLRPRGGGAESPALGEGTGQRALGETG